MTDRPILFSVPMVRAILEGRKTQTRRVVKLPKGIVSLYRPFPNDLQNVQGVDADGLIGWYAAPSACPYGVPGDRLWVRETFRKAHPKGMGSDGIIYRADAARSIGMDEYSDRHRWRPSIFMPRSASRITLEVVNVRVEQLQEISKADVIAEGVEGLADVHAGWHQPYAQLWDEINGHGSWDANPWVWVVEFKKVTK